MKLLVLGGTVFLSRAVVEDALRRGHEVVCAARGTSGSAPTGAELVVWDRTAALPAALAERGFDAVVEVARQPSWVRAAVAAWPAAHWVFVSTVSVYTDDATPGGRPETRPVHEPRHDDVDLDDEPDAYGPMKVSCEQTVATLDSATVIRPGLIVGPGDPTGRFSYWPRRLAAGDAHREVLAPGGPADVVQVIDVRDLAAFVVTACEQRLRGTYDGVGPAVPFADLLLDAAAGVGARVELTWVDQDFLAEHAVQPWAGPESIPLWLPRPAYDGMLAHDVGPALADGLEVRSVAETTRDTLAWLDATAEAAIGGITLERERELLDAWHART